MSNWKGVFFYLTILIIPLFEKTYIFLYGKEQFKKRILNQKGCEKE